MIDFNFNKPYKRTDFLHFLEHDFLPDDFVMLEEKLENLNFTTNYTIEATHLGVCRSMGLDVYEILHSSSHDARVGIAQDAFRLMLNKSYNNRALIIFHSEGNKQYRFSLLQIEALQSDQSARITRSFSNPRRYSFLLGEGAHVKTPKQFLIDKGKIRERTENAKRLTIIDDLENRFSVEVLTKEFYRELSDWYFWAVKNVSFPNDINDENDNGKYNAENVIRLITRLIFVWFLRQKELVKPDFFDTEKLSGLLKDFDAQSATQHNYYRAILQNLFFATLNQETGKRRFAEDKGYLENRSTNTIKNYYRYESEFSASTGEVINYFSQIPFLNGGLFECLDAKIKDERIFYWDGFSRNPKRQARVANELFFAETKVVDLSSEYNDTRMKAVKVSGIIEILKRYNFTVEENTPIDVVVALDPELLGKVFENLLGAYNPETQETARKQTGSFYTPREIVSYMVNESLIAYLKTNVPDLDEDILRQLLSYENNSITISETQTENLIQALFNCKILDPACGSGAFPMGVLQQMVHVLGKLDPDNSYWNKVVMDDALAAFDNAGELSDDDKAQMQEEIERTFDDNVNHPNYARKLYLIENCIYGVDIQSIAVQISKLRFFISLICEQTHGDNAANNFGIRPLPNLETKFVAANTLIGIEKNEEDMLLFKQDKILKLIRKLEQVRHRQFLVTNASQKKSLREADEALRNEIADEVQKLYIKKADDAIFRLKIDLKQREKELEVLNNKPDVIRKTVETDLFGSEKETAVNVTENKRQEIKTLITRLNNQIKNGSNYSRLEAVVQLAQQLTSWNPYDQNTSSPFFDPEWMFGIKEGFDVVIGNPPYVNIEKIDASIKKNISKFRTAYQKYDLYVLFYEKGIDILRKNGQLCYITSNKFLSQGYGLLLRQEFLKYFISEIVNFNYDIFEAATVRTCIFHIQKSLNTSNDKIKIIDLETPKDAVKFLSQKYNFLKQNVFENTDDNNFRINLNYNKLNVLNKISNNCIRVEEAFSVNYGLRPSSEKLNLKKEAFIHLSNETEKYKKYFEGKDMGYWLIKNYSYLDYRPDVMYNAMFSELFETEKLVGLRTLSDISKLRFIYDDNKYYCNDSVVILTLWHFFEKVKNQTIERNITKEKIETSKNFNYQFVQAILNSKVIKFYFNELFYDGTHFYPNHMKSLPLKETDKNNQKLFIELVNKIYVSTKSEIHALEQQIDNLVYKLYDLTYDEVKVVDPAFALSEEEYNNIVIE